MRITDKEAHRRYMSDPLARAFVDNICSILSQMEITPYEVRQLTQYAIIKYMLENPISNSKFWHNDDKEDGE